MLTKVHVLVVDDEPDIRDSFQEYLELKGYRVSCADCSENARNIVKEQNIDVALLDVAMPGEDGLSLARYLREHTDVAIIIVASAGEAMDRIIGIEVGADDYLAKPVDLQELSARILAVLRWKKGELVTAPSSSTTDESNCIQFGDCRLDIDSHRLFGAAGQSIPITAMDFRVLKVFAERPGKVLSRNYIFSLTRGTSAGAIGRSVDIQIGRLRRKIERDPGTPRVIKTVHSVGYVYSPYGV